MDPIKKAKPLPKSLDNASRTRATDYNQTNLSNYWINEIKSQEDTARQIIAVCILLFGASISLVSSNSATFVQMVEINIKSNLETYPDTPDIILIAICVSIWVAITISFLFIWIQALRSASIALKIEELKENENQYIEHLSNIAKIKHKHCHKAITTIAIGSTLVTFVVAGLFISAIGYTPLGMIIWAIAGLGLITLIIFNFVGDV
jgi:hypothetical protein